MIDWLIDWFFPRKDYFQEHLHLLEKSVFDP